MKLKNVLQVAAILVIALIFGCSNNLSSNLVSSMTSNLTSSSFLEHSNSDMESSEEITNMLLLKTVDLGVAGEFAILSKSGITNVYKSAIVGNIGSSPITGAAILVSCAEVTGTIFTVDAAGPLPCSVNSATKLTTAVGDMQKAYTDAAGRLNPEFSNLGAGNIGGKTLTPGLYKWTSSVVIPADITISGGSADVFIFQVEGTLNMSNAVKIILSGGVQAKNIFWVSAGNVTIGTTAHFEGNILGKNAINLQTGASINGRMLAQTAVTLQMNSVVIPK